MPRYTLARRSRTRSRPHDPRPVAAQPQVTPLDRARQRIAFFPTFDSEARLGLDSSIRAGTELLTAFTTKLNAACSNPDGNPLYDLSWGDGAIDSAAKLKAWRLVKSYLDRNINAESMVRELEHEVSHLCRTFPRSTSQMSNLTENAYRVALAEVTQSMRRLVDSRARDIALIAEAEMYAMPQVPESFIIRTEKHA